MQTLQGYHVCHILEDMPISWGVRVQCTTSSSIDSRPNWLPLGIPIFQPIAPFKPCNAFQDNTEAERKEQRLHELRLQRVAEHEASVEPTAWITVPPSGSPAGASVVF